MRTISSLLALSILAAACLAAAPAQEETKPPKSGFARVADALTQGTGPLLVEIDGKSINPKGFKPGFVTGGLFLAPGSRTVKFTREGVKSGTTRVTVAPDETTTLIPYAEKVAASDDEPAHWQIRILRLKQQNAEKDRSATFVSVSRQPEVKVEMQAPDKTWTAAYVKRLAIARAPIAFTRGYVPLKSADGKLTSIPVASQGNYVVLLYDDADGKLQSTNFEDRKFLSAD